MRRNLAFILIPVFLVIFIIGCQVQVLPPPPQAFGGPIGRATIFYPDWATAPDGKLALNPDTFTLDATGSASATLAATDDYVWNTFYFLNNANSWVPVTSSCTPVAGSQWCLNSGNAAINVDLNTFVYGHNFAIGYTCTDMGANTFDCSQGRWKLVIFDIEQPGLNQPPTAQITAPASGITVVEGAAVTITGTGTDPEDGTLSGNSLTWSSDIDGDLGSGNSINPVLSTGTHTITLTVTDSDTATGTDTITIDVTPYTPDPNACVQNDGGDDPTQKGTTTKGNTSFTDYCAGTNLVEYYCQNNEIQSKNYVPVAHEICRDGKFELRPKITSVDQCYLNGDYDGVDYPACPGQALIRNLRYYSYNTIQGTTQGDNLWEMHNYGNDCVRKWTLCMHGGIPASITNCQTESDASEGPWVYDCEPPACPAGQNSLQGYVMTSHYAQPGLNTYRYMNRYNRICMGNGYRGVVINCHDLTEQRTCTLDCPAGTVEIGVEITDPVIPNLIELQRNDHKNWVKEFRHNKLCVVTTCEDGIQNGQETDVDCGGSYCDKCQLGDSCTANSDCFNENCENGICTQNPTSLISVDSTVTAQAKDPNEIPDPVCPIDTTMSSTMYNFHAVSNNYGRKYAICSEPGITTDIKSCSVLNPIGEGPWNTTCSPPACNSNFVELAGNFTTSYKDGHQYRTTYHRICMNGITRGAVEKCEDFTEIRTCGLSCPITSDLTIDLGEVTVPIFNSTAPVTAANPYSPHNFWHHMICIEK